MVYLDETKSFTPTIKKAFPGDEVIVVRHAVGGTPIRLWFKGGKLLRGRTRLGRRIWKGKDHSMPRSGSGDKPVRGRLFTGFYE